MVILVDAVIPQLPATVIALPLAGALACVIAPRGARTTMVLVGIMTTAAALLLAMDVLEHGAREYALGGWLPPWGSCCTSTGSPPRCWRSPPCS